MLGIESGTESQSTWPSTVTVNIVCSSVIGYSLALKRGVIGMTWTHSYIAWVLGVTGRAWIGNWRGEKEICNTYSIFSSTQQRKGANGKVKRAFASMSAGSGR